MGRNDHGTRASGRLAWASGTVFSVMIAVPGAGVPASAAPSRDRAAVAAPEPPPSTPARSEVSPEARRAATLVARVLVRPRDWSPDQLTDDERRLLEETLASRMPITVVPVVRVRQDAIVSLLTSLLALSPDQEVFVRTCVDETIALVVPEYERVAVETYRVAVLNAMRYRDKTGGPGDAQGLVEMIVAHERAAVSLSERLVSGLAERLRGSISGQQGSQAVALEAIRQWILIQAATSVVPGGGRDVVEQAAIWMQTHEASIPRSGRGPIKRAMRVFLDDRASLVESRLRDSTRAYKDALHAQYLAKYLPGVLVGGPMLSGVDRAAGRMVDHGHALQETSLVAARQWSALMGPSPVETFEMRFLGLTRPDVIEGLGIVPLRMAHRFASFAAPHAELAALHRQLVTLHREAVDRYLEQMRLVQRRRGGIDADRRVQVVRSVADRAEASFRASLEFLEVMLAAGMDDPAVRAEAKDWARRLNERLEELATWRETGYLPWSPVGVIRGPGNGWFG